MSLKNQLKERSSAQCELCAAASNLEVYEVPDAPVSGLDGSIFACTTCIAQITASATINAKHWRCLNTSMWSEHDSVKVVVWRMLSRLKKEAWSQELIAMMYLEDEVLNWAKATEEGQEEEEKIVHRDVNGAVLQNGDSVVLIKDLKVKGSSMVAKQGTAVRRIKLDRKNAEYIEGKVGPTQIVIITKYVKKI